MSKFSCFNRLSLALLVTFTVALTCCKIYRFKDVNIEPDVKTVKVNFIENKARFKSPQFSPLLTEKLRQKVNNQTRLTQIQGDNADYEISGYISDYSQTTAGVSNQQAATNRLNVSVHIIFKNRKNEKKSREEDVSRNFDFSASLSLDQAESQLLPTIVQNMSDEIFNRIFSNW